MMTGAGFNVWIEEQTRFAPFDMASHEAALAEFMAEWLE